MPIQAGDYRPQLRVREIPFDLDRAIRLESFHSLSADLSPALLVDFMAFNMLAEFGETLIHHLHRTYGVMADSDSSKAFVTQELRHAGAVHVVNRWLIGDGYTRTPFGRVSKICEAVHAPEILSVMEAARDEKRRPAILKRLAHMLAAFETTFGLFLNLTQFQLLRDFESIFLRHPAFFYVALYHAAEEAEHAHVSWEYYENTYRGETMWGADGLEATLTSIEKLLDNHVRVVILIGQRIGHEISLVDLEELQTFQSHRQFLANLRSGAFHPDSYSAFRRECVEAWDNVWEPKFRREVEARLAAIDGA